MADLIDDKIVQALLFPEQYNCELEEAEAEYEKGNHISHDEMKERIKSW